MSALFELNLDLLKTYQSLDSDSKLIMQLFALINHNINLQFISSCLKQQGILTEEKEHFSESKIQEIKDALIKLHLLNVDKQLQEYVINCNNMILHAVLKDAVKLQKLLTILQNVQQKHQVDDYNSYRWLHQYLCRDIRILVYTNDIEGFVKYASCKTQNSLIDILSELCSVIPFDKAWLQTLSEKMRGLIIRHMLENNCFSLVSSEASISFIQDNIAVLNGVHEILAKYYLLCGETERCAYHLQQSVDPYRKALLSADLFFCQNQFEQAIAAYQTALKIMRKNSGRTRAFFPSYHGVFYLLAVISHLGEQQALQIINKVNQEGTTLINHICKKLIYALQGREIAVYDYEMERYLEKIDINSSIALMLLFWISPKYAANNVAVFERYFNHMVQYGYKLFARFYAEILAKLVPNSLQYEKYIQTDTIDVKINFVEIIKVKETWEIFLNQLAEVSATVTANIAQSQTGKRLVWLLDTNEYFSNEYRLVPAEQAQNAKGNAWKLPREISLKKFYEEPPFYLTEHDRKIRDTLSKGSYSDFKWNISAALPALVGHPHIYDMRNKACKLELSEGQPHLLVSHCKDGFKIKLSQHAFNIGA